MIVIEIKVEILLDMLVIAIEMVENSMEMLVLASVMEMVMAQAHDNKS